jgi:hypothetical protein
LSKEVKNLPDGTLDGAESYFVNANKTTIELVETYCSAEKENGETYGEEALYEQIVLAGRVGKFATQVALMDLFVEKYPASPVVGDVRVKRQRLNGTDFSNSYTSVYVNDKFHTIGVVDFESVDEGKRSVDLRIGTQSRNGQVSGDNITLLDKGVITIGEILPGKVSIIYDSPEKNTKTEKKIILKGNSEVFAGIEVYVKDVAVQEIAHVSIIPEVKRTKTEADFTFRIGIEKRAVELSPEKTNKMLKDLNESIGEWENIVERLWEVVKGLKGACFATSTLLMLKNMVTGLDGGAMARQRVMEEYKVICDRDYATMTRTECYNHLSSQVEGNVSAMTVVLNAVNTKMQSSTVGNVGPSGGLFGGESVTDQEKYKVELRKQIGSENVEVDLGGGVKLNVPKSEIDSVSQLRAVLLYEESRGKGVVEDSAKVEMNQVLRNTALRVQQKQIQDETKSRISPLLKENNNFNVQSSPDNSLDTYSFSGIKKGEIIKEGNWNEVKNEEYVEFIEKGTKDYFVVLRKGAGNRWIADRAYVIGANNNLGVSEGFNAEFISTGSSGGCSYSWPKTTAMVSYYEAGDNKGLPAIVPFDLNEGWYVMVPNSGGTFLDDSPQGYTASADVKYFKICNIGSDRVMQNGKGDDLCQSFDANSVGSVDSFGGCSGVDVKKLYGCAREAIRQASAQAGKSEININVCNERNIIKKGQPMSQIGGFECQDFMSPEDCKLMFNVCDPVICPPSRCDLGGKMPVADVIQTGVIGSLVLCLPNWRDGVMFPICLSGVHAGIDSYLSILKSDRDCLEKSLETGEHVGICDEITSIYKCEFFWRQLSPLMDQLLPGLIQELVAPGNRVHGGGEYALVQQSWNSMQQSISYFRDVYAQNAFKAFNIRSSEEAGSEVCKAFVGTSVPGGADLIDSLLEPESPSQFYAQFSEMTFTGATVPVTSQYKVYYHIYAGNDQGVQYRIYLKNPPETGYYRSNPTIQVKTGYIAKGSSADETVDFIAPEGYKELCVVVNAKEECGFKQVTTDFGLNYIQNKYVQEQAENTDIKSEKECISGTPSAISMANLNVQAGVEESVNPEIAMEGIVRVCASINPGSGVDKEDSVTCGSVEDCGKGYICKEGYCEDIEGNKQKAGSRWKNVGTCGDTGLVCWLDTDSVKNDLKAIESIEGSSISILDERKGLIDTGVLRLEDVQKILDSARLKIKSLSSDDLKVPGEKVNGIIVELNSVIGTSTFDGDVEDKPGAGTNRDRAEALALKASVYRMIVMELTKGLIVKPVPVASEVVVKDDKECDKDGDCASIDTQEGYCDAGGVCRLRGVVREEETITMYLAKQGNGKNVSFIWDEYWRWSVLGGEWNNVSDKVTVGANVDLTSDAKQIISNMGNSNEEKGKNDIEKIGEIEETVVSAESVGIVKGGIIGGIVGSENINSKALRLKVGDFYFKYDASENLWEEFISEEDLWRIVSFSQDNFEEKIYGLSDNFLIDYKVYWTIGDLSSEYDVIPNMKGTAGEIDSLDDFKIFSTWIRREQEKI